MNITKTNIALFNSTLRYETPEVIVQFAMQLASNPLLTSSFGRRSAGLLHLVSKHHPTCKTLWCDTGFNTPETYVHMSALVAMLNLDLEIVTPQFTTAYIEHRFGRPKLDDPNFEAFSKIVKLDPMQKALARIKPDVWFTNLRKDQTEYRKNLDVLSFSAHGILKVAPFFYYTDKQMDQYLKKHNLPMLTQYFDPVKASNKRECGIHFANKND